MKVLVFTKLSFSIWLLNILLDVGIAFWKDPPEMDAVAKSM